MSHAVWREESAEGMNTRGIWGWAAQHPGTLAVGAVVLLALCFLPHSKELQPAGDFAADETPLFI